MASASDDGLEETQKRVNLRTTMKAAAVAINEMSGLGYGRKSREPLNKSARVALG